MALPIKTTKHLSYILHINENTLRTMMKNDWIKAHYNKWEKVKLKSDGTPKLKNGKPQVRIINPSKGKLKEIQHRIHSHIMSKLNLPDYEFGGRKGRDNIKNAAQHLGRTYKLVTDMTNFFGQITNKMVYDGFIRYGMSHDVARILTRLVTFEGHVPQGAPTSTDVANMVFSPIGEQLLKIISNRDIRFTTFVDDITFSSSHDFKDMVNSLLQTIIDAGFIINRSKTHYTKKAEITGVCVHSNHLEIKDELKLRLAHPENYNERQYAGMKRYANNVRNYKKKDISNL